jgi:hypothetical protein
MATVQMGEHWEGEPPRRTMWFVWNGGHVCRVSLELWKERTFRRRFPWKLFPIWYNWRTKEVYCWRRDRITAADKMFVEIDW